MSNDWRIVQEAFSVRVEADDEIIYVRHLPDWNDENYASELKGALSNAAIIRSSRDLLEALQMLLESNTQHSSIRVGDAIDCAKKAIAKALAPQS